MSEEVRAAVFGNVGTMVVFRVGAYDAEVLEKEFMPAFTAEDLVNLGFVQVYLKLMIDGVSSPPFSAQTLPPIKKPDISFKTEIIDNSRKVFARTRAAVEEEIRIWHEPLKPLEMKDRRKDLPRAGGIVGGPSMSYTPSASRVEPAQQKEVKPNPFAGIVVNPSGVIKTPAKGGMQEKLTRQPDLSRPLTPDSPKLTQPNRPSQQSHQIPRPIPTAHPESPKPTTQRVDSKKPSEKNLSELREALAAVVKKPETVSEAKSKASSQTEKRTNVETSTQAPRSASSSQPHKAPEQKPKEIPEDVLRKMLEVNEE